jgi:hypothetical protein
MPRHSETSSGSSRLADSTRWFGSDRSATQPAPVLGYRLSDALHVYEREGHHGRD